MLILSKPSRSRGHSVILRYPMLKNNAYPKFFTPFSSELLRQYYWYFQETDFKIFL